MKRPAPLLALLLTACSSAGLEPDARYESEFPGDGYVIVLKGTRGLMTHDPVSALFDRTYATEAHIRVRKMEGVVSAADAQVIQLEDFGDTRRIQLLEGTQGTIDFKDGRVSVDLRIPYDNTLVPFYFNGSYTLTMWP